MRMLSVAVLVSSAVAAAQDCTSDSACGMGNWCLIGPGCDGPPRGTCVPDTFATSGDYCGCDGRQVKWQRSSNVPFPRWQEADACGYDAGAPRSWRDEKWADAFDDAGLRRAPKLRVAAVQPSSTIGCDGSTAKLAPPAGQRFPASSKDRFVVFGCEAMPTSSWSPTSITIKVPTNAESGCFALVEGDERALRRYRAACLLTAKGKRVKFAGDEAFKELTTCQMAAGAPINQLEVLHKPKLMVSAFGEHGLASWDTESSLLSEGQEPTSIDWNAPNADVVKVNGEPQPNQGTRTLPLKKKVTITATNRCGTTTRTIRGSSTRLPWARSTIDLEDEPGGVRVFMPYATDQDRKLGISVAGKASAPKEVVVPAGSTSVVIPVAPPPMPTSASSTLQITGPGASSLIAVTVTAQRPRGFADLHVHQFANLAFGGVGLYGDANAAPEAGLKDCTASHGSNGKKDYLNRLMQDSAGLRVEHQYSTVGWGTFEAWPDATDYTHQQVHALHLKEAWRGGLRLMVMHAVENGTGCGVARLYSVTGTKLNCDPTDSVKRQLAAARAFAAANSDWYQIVTTPGEARDAMAGNKLAVVLGVEVDWLLKCQNWGGSNCGNAQADELIAFLKAQQVSHVFPTHFVSNAFGGSAMMNPVTASHDGRKEACSKPGYKFSYGGFGPTCNPDGLTPVGDYFVRKLMEQKFIIDIDHESLHTRQAIETIATELKYPMVSGHSTFFDVSNGYMLSENVLRPETVTHIKTSGGMVGLVTNQANSNAEIKQVNGAPKHACGKSVEDFAQAYRYALQHNLSIGFGSDFNGFNGQPGGRRPDKCLGGGKGPSSDKDPTLVVYPFIDDAGEIFENPLVGTHRYDVNTDGLAHIGMYPDFIEALRKLGFTREELTPLMTSADSYIRIWEGIEARGSVAALPTSSSAGAK